MTVVPDWLELEWYTRDAYASGPYGIVTFGKQCPCPEFADPSKVIQSRCSTFEALFHAFFMHAIQLLYNRHL